MGRERFGVQKADEVESGFGLVGGTDRDYIFQFQKFYQTLLI